MTKKVKWGILSTGRIADWFATDFPEVHNGEIVAVASRKLESAETFADKFNISKAYGCYDDMLSDPDIDVIYIGTPHTLHLENAIDAMRAGKAVLCEKPLTIGPEECKQLIAAQKETGAYLMEAMWTWFLPAIQKAQVWVDDGRIGDLKHIKADFGYPVLPYDENRREYDVRYGGGAMLEMGIYPVALAYLFTGMDPQDIKVSGHRAPNGVEDDLVATMMYGDTIGTIGTSYRCRLRNTAYIIGEKGYITIPDFFRASECFLFELDEQIDHFHDGRKSLGFCYEAIAVGEDLLAGRTQSEIYPLSASMSIQQHMAIICEKF